jgi:hypothetical protein
MIQTLRQGFDKLLTGVGGTSIQSAYTKPLIEPSRAVANVSWLPYPYGPLPDVGPWSKKKETDNWENERDEKPTPESGTGNNIQTDKPPWYGQNANNIVMLMVVVACAWFLVKYMPEGK